MTTADAEYLVAKLFAAFPFHQQEMTAGVYVEAMQRLADPDLALRAVDEIIASDLRLPPVAVIRDTYDRVRPAPLALDMPEISEEKRLDNIRRRDILSEMLAKKIDMDEALARMNA